MQVIKRDGRAVSYDRSKIIVAIQKQMPKSKTAKKFLKKK